MRHSLKSSRCKWKHIVCVWIKKNLNASNVESFSHTCAPDVCVAIVTAVAVAQSFIFKRFLHQQWLLLFVSVLRGLFLSSSPVIDFTLVKHTYRFEPLVCQERLCPLTHYAPVSDGFHTFLCVFSFRAWKYFYYCHIYCFSLLSLKFTPNLENSSEEIQASSKEWKQCHLLTLICSL